MKIAIANLIKTFWGITIPLFPILKLCGIINWNWLLVLLPLIIWFIAIIILKICGEIE